MRRWLGRVMLALAWLFAAAPAGAHFIAGTNVRVVHFAPVDDGIVAYYRISFGLVVADGLGPQQPDGTYLPAPFTTNSLREGAVVHWVDATAVRADPMGLAEIIARSHSLIAGATALTPEPLSARVALRGITPPFNTLAEAEAAVEGPAYPDFDGTAAVTDALVDATILYRFDGDPAMLAFASTLTAGEVVPDATFNLLVMHDGDGGAWQQQREGLLEEPVTIYQAPFAAAARMTVSGARHILSGLDHVLFVLCLVIGAATFGGLAWRVTGFTLGHSATLIAGFYGLVPDGAWFLPAVEIGIAASIVAVAVAALGQRSVTVAFAVTAGLGLLHGLGFSASLRTLMRPEDPDAIARLAAFNVGVELGQLALIVMLWPGLAWIARGLPERRRRIVEITAIGAIWVGAVWIIERLPALVAAA